MNCPECDGAMVMRFNRTSLIAFLGCARFPACRGTVPLRLAAIDLDEIRQEMEDILDWPRIDFF